MPVLPSADQLSRARLQPDTSIVRVNTGQVADAMQRAGFEVERVGRQVQQFADETASLHAQDALVELKRRKNQLTVGEGGYAGLQNAAATQPGVMKQYQERFDAAASEIQARLSPAARMKFSNAAKGLKNEFEAGFLTHAMREDLNHRGEVYKANVQVAAETMGINYKNPEALMRERTNIDRTVANYVAQNGIKDEAVIERMLQDARGSGHEQVINAYVADGLANEADTYFKAIKQEILPEKARAIQNMLKPEVAGQLGRDISDKLYNMHLAGASESDIFDEKLKLTEGKSMDVIRVTDALYNDRVQALDKDRAKQSGAILVSAWNGGNALNDPRLKEIDASDPVLGAQIRGQIYSIKKRAAAGSAPPTVSSMAAYSALSDKVREGGMDNDEIVHYGTLSGLKDATIKSLITMNNSRNDKAASARLNTNLVNAGIPKSARGDREKTDAYKGFVTMKLQEWKDANPGKVPTTEDQRAIISSAAVEHVEVNKYWFNKTVEAFRAEGKTTYPKYFGQLLSGYEDEDILRAYTEVQNARAKMTAKDRNYSDAELIEAWKAKEAQRTNGGR